MPNQNKMQVLWEIRGMTLSAAILVVSVWIYYKDNTTKILVNCHDDRASKCVDFRGATANIMSNIGAGY